MIFAAIVGAMIFAAQDGQYGFGAAPYTYDQEYRDCAWPDDGSGRRYVPGYA